MAKAHNFSRSLDADLAEMQKALSLLHMPDSVIELRILDTGRTGTVSGYFDNFERLAEAAARWSGKAPALYITLNSCNPALLARSANRLTSWAKHTTADHDIVKRHWLPLDFDPVRPAGISSTDAEHEAARERARACMDWLHRQGWPKPISADSGNGAHVVYPIDLPNDEKSAALVKRCLEALALLFSDQEVSLDLSIFNASRIWKLYGTKACKGENLPERPHRLAHLLGVPETLQAVSIDHLARLAAMLPPPRTAASHRLAAERAPFDLPRWIAEHGLHVAMHGPWGAGGRMWVLNPCPWNPDHTNRAAYIVQFADGAIAAGCHHNGCADNDWHRLREVYEPGWRDRRAGQPAQGFSPSHQRREGEEIANGTSVSFVSTSSRGFDVWPEPMELPDPLLPVESFESKLLPEDFRPWIEDIAERMQCPPDFPAVASMSALATVMGRRVGIRPKQYDDWLVVANLWAAVIGRPGLLKTPAIQEPLKILWHLELEAGRVYQQELERWKVQQIIAKEREKVDSEKIRSALKKGVDATMLAEALLTSTGSPPIRRRLLVNDSTVEKLGELLNQNPQGLLVFRDELTGFLRTMDREGHEGDRAFYLEAWNGTGRYVYDRIGRGTIEIEAACVSVLGGIQPGPLAQYLRMALEGGSGDDGFMQRFQLLVWPDISRQWRNVDRWPQSTAKQRVIEVFARLHEISVAALDAHCHEDLSGIPYCRFSPEAQELFTEWQSELEHRLRRGEEHPAFEAHLAKYRSLVPSLALLIHLADGGANPVTADALVKACAWAEYLESHARRVYSRGLSPDYVVARALAAHILKGDLPREFALRDVYRPQWTELTKPEGAAKAVEVLLDLDWLREYSEETGGRPSRRFLANPRIWEESHEVA
jgi:putative DNA primase/helicase